MSGKEGTNSVTSFSGVVCFISASVVASGVISTRGRGLRAIFVALLLCRKSIACSSKSSKLGLLFDFLFDSTESLIGKNEGMRLFAPASGLDNLLVWG